jgi:sulfoxide reductase heme-binding subunit YedZ
MLIGLVPARIMFVRAFSNALGPIPLRVLENGLWRMGAAFPDPRAGGDAAAAVRAHQPGEIPPRHRPDAFIYVVLHLATYLALDKQFDWGEIGKDIIKRPYITIGMAAFLMLVPLAVTSNRYSIRKLGSAGWRKLHRLVYPAVLLGAVHYLMLVKAWPPEPIVYLLIAVALLAVRLVKPARRARAA